MMKNFFKEKEHSSMSLVQVLALNWFLVNKNSEKIERPWMILYKQPIPSTLIINDPFVSKYTSAPKKRIISTSKRWK